MTKSKFSKSVRKFVRREKARLRKADTGPEEYKEVIRALYQRFSPNRSGPRTSAAEPKPVS